MAMKLENIDGGTKLYVIIGDPISAVRTPSVFNEMFARQNINAVLVPLHVAAEHLDAVWTGLKAMRNLHGVVITMPHKSRMCGLVHALGQSGKVVGSINAARRRNDGTWEGDMFDGMGCVNGLKKQGHAVEGKRVFLMGTGGAGSAIAVALAQAGVHRLVITDIDTARLGRVIANIRHEYPQLSIEEGRIGREEFDLAINATPLGMCPEDPLPFDLSALPESTLVVDVITKPEFTSLLLRAQEMGHQVQTGRHMHRGQAVACAEFFGFDLDA
jgi:shikimate dehydrogenase